MYILNYLGWIPVLSGMHYWKISEVDSDETGDRLFFRWVVVCKKNRVY